MQFASAQSLIEAAKRGKPTFIENHTRKIYTETIGNNIFIGEVVDQLSLETDSVWRLKRKNTAGPLVIEEYADSGKFNQQWSNRGSAFPPVPFANHFSVIFDGINDFVDITNDSSLDFGTLVAFSLNVWVKSTSTNQTYIEKQVAGVGWEFRTISNKLRFEHVGAGGALRVDSTSDVGQNDGSWHMVSATYDGSGNASGAILYFDGAAVAKTTIDDSLSGSTLTAGDIAIGSSTDGAATNFTGNIDEVSVWSRDLTAGEITTIYNSGTPADVNIQVTTNLVSFWRMGDQDAFPALLDNKGSNDGTMTNMVAGDIVLDTAP